MVECECKPPSNNGQVQHFHTINLHQPECVHTCIMLSKSLLDQVNMGWKPVTCNWFLNMRSQYVCVCVVCVYTCVCVCVYTCVCIVCVYYVCMHVHGVCMHVYVCVYMCVHVCMRIVCVCTVYVCVYMCVYVCTCTYVCVYVCTCVYVCI